MSTSLWHNLIQLQVLQQPLIMHHGDR